MRGCELIIITESGGESTLFEAKATLEEEREGVKVRYLIDGDEGELLFSENSVSMTRRGKCGLQATFCEGENTQMLLGDAALHGAIPVRTTHYSSQKDAAKIYADLCYELFGADNIQMFSLKIQVFFSEEK